jgi:predicted AlkP superfamily phosphohydrolase/phosphomutase
MDTRESIFNAQLDSFKEGVLGIVFDTLDRVQHMFWKSRPDLIEQWYLSLDQLIGRIETRIQTNGNSDAQLLIMSDHGFNRFDHKVHLNKWLVDKGYLSIKNSESTSINDAIWSETQAYAIGLNSLYINRSGREGQGILDQSQANNSIEKIKIELMDWKGPDGQPVVSSVLTNEEAFYGPLSSFGPDLVIGYAPGYRASAETGTGNWDQNSIEINTDHWGADHCIDPIAVPGVLFRNQGLDDFPNPSYRDIPKMVVGKALKPGDPPASEDFSEEDQETVEERLKGLGYL